MRNRVAQVLLIFAGLAVMLSLGKMPKETKVYKELPVYGTEYDAGNIIQVEVPQGFFTQAFLSSRARNFSIHGIDEGLKTTEEVSPESISEETEAHETDDSSVTATPEPIGSEEPKEIPETPEVSEIPETSEPVYTYTGIQQEIWTTAALNIRSGPSVDFPVISGVGTNQQLSATAICNETGWYEIFYNGQTGYVASKYVTTTPIQPVLSQNTYRAIIEPLGNISSDFLERANSKLSIVPESLLDLFVSQGWQYYVSESDVNATYLGGSYGNVKGYTDQGNKVIYLDYRDEALSAVVHEFGHFVDVYNGYPSTTAEFINLYWEEKDAFCSVFSYSHNKLSSLEVFAEAFYRYLSDGTTLEENCPGIYEYLSRFIPA